MVHGLLAGVEPSIPATNQPEPPPLPSGSPAAAAAGLAHQALFRLLNLVSEAGLLRRVETLEDLGAVAPGDLVDLYGVSFGNPITRVLHFLATMMPYLQSPPEPPRAGRARPAPALSAQDAEDQQLQQLVTGVVSAASQDLRENEAMDLILETDADVTAVVTLRRSILGSTGDLQVEGRPLRVLGKAVSILGPEHPVNLLRHSVLAATSPQTSRDMLAELADSGLELEMADPIVEGPGLEIVPFAVLI